jgi:hypothetical protein
VIQCATGYYRFHVSGENLRAWRGSEIIDPDGDKIGKPEAISST